MEATAGLSLTPPDVAPINPVQTTVVAASGTGETESTGSGFRLPPPTVYALPEPKQTRNMISAVREKINITSLQGGMEIAFDAYGKVQKLQAKVDASNGQADQKEYEGAVGRAIDIIEQVHDLALRRASKDDVANTRYLLSFLYLKAAMLPEAIVMGEAVARWGDVEDPSTREAGIIALAAAQEMSDVQWGIKEDLGELRQMVAIAGGIATQVARRKPERPDLDEHCVPLRSLQSAADCGGNLQQNSPVFRSIRGSPDGQRLG